MIEVVEESYEIALDGVPGQAVEAGPKTIRAWASVGIHVQEGQFDFVKGEGSIEMSKLEVGAPGKHKG